jgi:thioredoxin reductase (NADPH)
MHRYDLVIIGAGPIGLELGAACERYGLDYLILERGQLAQTIADWPSQSRFFSSPERMAVAGVPFQTVHNQLAPKEEYLAYLRTVADLYDLKLRLYEEVTEVRRDGDGFRLHTRKTAAGPPSRVPGTAADAMDREYRAARIVLAVGDMAKPKPLGIPGEELPNVTHLFEDTHRYFRQRLLVVGGRNSAVEAAVRAWRAGVDVSVSYRRPEFDKERVYSRLHLEITLLAGKGKIPTYMQTVPREIRPQSVLLEYVDKDLNPTGETTEVGTDFVFLATGYHQDFSLATALGVEFRKKKRLPILCEETMETTVPGVYLAGTAIGHNRDGYTTFVGTSHVHVQRIMGHILGRNPDEITAGTVGRRFYPFTSKDIQSE